MLRYLARRLLWAVPVLLTATTCAFLVLHLIPGETHFTTPLGAACLELLKRWPPFTAGA